jgi:hypothetical protein
MAEKISQPMFDLTAGVGHLLVCNRGMLLESKISGIKKSGMGIQYMRFKLKRFHKSKNRGLIAGMCTFGQLLICRIG